mmetsp:Transcript_31815/g.45804  ORF Transcript_31815/g.45804 Transcript_31815/m.45804 type:complete len:118 (+) Transcript_31815:478-831(+)
MSMHGINRLVNEQLWYKNLTGVTAATTGIVDPANRNAYGKTRLFIHTLVLYHESGSKSFTEVIPNFISVAYWRVPAATAHSNIFFPLTLEGLLDLLKESVTTKKDTQNVITPGHENS